MPVIRIDGRIKRLYSIWLKLKRQKIDLEQVYDFVALRIVTAVGEGLLRGARHHPPDVVAGARPHQGLHRDAAAQRLSVAAHLGHQRARLPVRGADPHRGNGRRAEEGIAAHWKYKEGRVGAGRDEQYFQWLRQLLEWQQEVRDPQEFLTNLKIDLYPEEVYTFTPRGQVKVLPQGIDAGRFRLRDSHRRRPSVRRRARQRPHGAAAHQAEERRHRRDRHQPDAQAEPRLAQFRRDLARAQQDQAPHSGRGEAARRSSSGASCSRRRRGASTSISTSCSTSERAARRRPASSRFQKATSCSRRSATASCRRSSVLDKLVPQGELKEKAPEHPVVSAVKRVLKPGARPPIASWCAASTT